MGGIIIYSYSRNWILNNEQVEYYFYLFLYNDDTKNGGRGISWATKEKVQQANYFGSLTQASSIRVGSFNGEEIYAPFKSLLPMVQKTLFDY